MRVLTAIAVLLLVGCASLERNAYRTHGTVAYLVDGAMNTWGDYVRSGQATPEQQMQVKLAYGKYQGAEEAAHIAVTIYKQSTDPAKVFPQALLDALENNADEVVNLIIKLLPPDKAKKVKRVK